MTAVALLSAKGSPGVTTTALALTWLWPLVHPGRRVLLAECDPAGADIATGPLAAALDGSRGLLPLAARRAPDPVAAVWENLVALDDDARRLLLPGPTDPARASAVAPGWATLADALDGLAGREPPVDVLLDLGRIRTAHEPGELRRRAHLVVLVTGSGLPAVVAARAAAAELTGGPPVALLVIGERRPYPAGEIAGALGLPLAGTLPLDAAAAAALTSSGGAPGRRLARSALYRGVRRLAADLPAAAREPAPRPTGQAAGTMAGVAGGR